MVSEEFVLKAKIALMAQKTRIVVATRIYSHLVESSIRSHPEYEKLLVIRKDKSADRKKTAKHVKKLLTEQLKNNGLSMDDFTTLFEGKKEANIIYTRMVETEKLAFKDLKPLLKDIPLYHWMKSVKGLGLNFSVKLLGKLQDVKRFHHPSALKKYCGTAPGLRKIRGQEAHFVPELKGILLGQVAKNFLMNNSQYKTVYDKKKKGYQIKYAKELVLTEKKKELKKKITKEDWTKLKVHNYALKAMINRFLVELWEASFIVEGIEPPTNPYILNDPKHNRETMIVQAFKQPEVI